jgi:hypothetical protein
MEVSAEKISEVLSDPESLKQIGELAEMLRSGAFDDPPPQNFAGDGASAEGGANSENESSDAAGIFEGIDFSQVFQILALLSDPPKDKNVDFLSALKPLISEEKQPKIERSIKILKLYDMFEVLRANGLLDGLSNII